MSRVHLRKLAKQSNRRQGKNKIAQRPAPDYENAPGICLEPDLCVPVNWQRPLLLDLPRKPVGSTEWFLRPPFRLAFLILSTAAEPQYEEAAHRNSDLTHDEPIP